MKHVRPGDVVYMTHHMSNCGEVVEVFYKPVRSSTGPGTFSKEQWVRFKSQLTGQIVTARRQDVTLQR